MTNLLDYIPDSWGPRAELGGAAVAFTRVNPGCISNPKTTAHTALIFHTPQQNRELSISSDRKLIRDAPAGALEVLPADLELYSRWQSPKQNTLFVINHENLKRIAIAEFERDEFELTPSIGSTVDNRMVFISNMVRAEIDSRSGQSDHLLLDSLQNAFWIYVLRTHSTLKKSGLLRCARGGLTVANIKRVEEYMQNNLSRKIRVADLAEVVGISSSHFMRAYRETCETTVFNRLTDMRLARAAHLITSTAAPLSLIARECGFGTNSYMTAVMRQRWATKPTDLRKTVYRISI
ncbi:helix-turn-helix domain-containing protein [Brucella intermedia]|uniref:helix-turn-helix domain-containing protein n=1 Tax=Brucella intermedia TaxID=94625 RepID=UPI00124D912A|nr:AraC family transcriptional regulator [Brucella intermedia]KAB2689878.1 helix-turn-helix transcriptional regulator [Brucella intermedia]